MINKLITFLLEHRKKTDAIKIINDIGSIWFYDQDGKTIAISETALDELKLYSGAKLTDVPVSIFGIPIIEVVKMLPNDVMALLIVLANARDDNHIDYYRQQAQQLLEKYKRPTGTGPSEYKATTETPIPEWY